MWCIGGTLIMKFKAQCTILVNIRPHYMQRSENGSVQVITTDNYIELNESTDTHSISVSQVSKQY
jgi:hypothetical protein